MKPGMLADVEGMEMKAECLHLSQERVEIVASQTIPVPFQEAAADQEQVGGQVSRAGIGVRVLRFAEGQPQAVQDKVKKAAIEFAAGMYIRNVDYSRNSGCIALHRGGEALPNQYQTGGGGQDLFQFHYGAQVMAEDRFPPHL